jgi:hypothetical protein
MSSRVVGSRAGSTVSSIKLQGHREVLSDERLIVAVSRAVDVPHHMRRVIKDLKEITEKFLSPSTNLMDRSIIFEDFLDEAAVAEPKEFSTPEKFPVLTDDSATATGFSDEGMIVALTLSTAARAESNRTEASAVHCNVEVDRRRASAAADASESSGCIKIQPMPVPTQSVFKKQGLEES